MLVAFGPRRGPSDPQTAFEYDLFLSYATEPDYRLARQVEAFLEAFHELPAKSVALRKLEVCRDGSDFSIPRAARTEPDHAVRDLIVAHLERSHYLLVLCSTRAPKSPYVAFEIDWFLQNRGDDAILLAITEGEDPARAPESVFPTAILERKLHARPFHDFRGQRKRQARKWKKVRDFEEQMTAVAAFLHDDTAGRLLPLWQQAALRSARRRLT